MKNSITKISLFILIGLIIFGCNTTKRVPQGKQLLCKSKIYVDGQKNNLEEVYNQLYQKQNSSFLGAPLRLYLYNWAKPKTDSIYKAKFLKNPKKYTRKVNWLSKKQVQRLGQSFWYSGIHNFLRKNGEAPVILDTLSTKKSLRRLKYYFFNKGYFDVKTDVKIDSISSKKRKLRYIITKGNQYTLDSIKTTIASPILDSLYLSKKRNSILKKGDSFDRTKIESEKNRITEDFRNNGVFRFQPTFISFDVDTISKKHSAKININIENETKQVEDSTFVNSFELYKINKVNIHIDSTGTKQTKTIKDSLAYKNFNIYSFTKLRYNPKALTDGVFILKDNYFSDNNTTLTSKYLSNLKVFNYPIIQYTEDKTQKNSLVANIYLIPRKKYTFGISTDFTHSNIQDFGISGNTSLIIRNIFKRAETLNIGFRGTIGASKYLANPNDHFFNMSEFGADVKLNFPRLLSPFKLDKIVPKTMIPFTTLSVGFSKQTNIGLDKQNFIGTLSHNWTPKKNTTVRFDLFNIQFVKNVNPGNYFNIYHSSYNTLNNLAIAYNANSDYFNNNNLIINSGVDGFINDVNTHVLNTSETDLKTIRSIVERKSRLTENNLIFASSLTFNKTSKKDLADNEFYTFRANIESAGNLLSLLARTSKQLSNQNTASTIFEVAFSQYVKTEFEFIKHWDLTHKNVLASRAFFGIAVPYGNSNSIPFSRSYFAGGSNDLRAWKSYGLGPGKTGSVNDFNEANMKLMFSTEYRFNVFKQLYGGLFVDAGNIWNVKDIVTNPDATFSGLKSLENIAVGSGFGLRYDFNFFVLRFDLGFKTYNPAKPEKEKWFREMTFNQSVLNIGINYPF